MALAIAATVFVLTVVAETSMEHRFSSRSFRIPDTFSRKIFVGFLGGFTAFILLTDQVSHLSQKVVIAGSTLVVLAAAHVSLPHEKR